MADIKVNFVHELKQSRLEKGLNQEEMAVLLGISKRTYQRLEDKKDFGCAFCNSIKNLATYSKASDYSFIEWVTKICLPNSQPNNRNLFKWEEGILNSFRTVNQSVRRVFSKNLEHMVNSKFELVVAISSILLTRKEKSISNLLIYLINENDGKGIPSEYGRQAIEEHSIY